MVLLPVEIGESGEVVVGEKKIVGIFTGSEYQMLGTRSHYHSIAHKHH